MQDEIESIDAMDTNSESQSSGKNSAEAAKLYLVNNNKMQKIFAINSLRRVCDHDEPKIVEALKNDDGTE